MSWTLLLQEESSYYLARAPLVVTVHCVIAGGTSSNNTPPQTTTTNIAKHHDVGIGEDSLTTFRDAIRFARHISVPYIWIDSLCIIQDDEEDWVTESAQMASIYENAYIVIAATQAEPGGID